MARKTKPAPVSDYAVGYKRPPQHTRFKKGQSGNPGGRRKQSSAAQENDREAVLSQPLTITFQGKRVRVTARRALYHTLLTLALKGDLRAMALLMKYEHQKEHNEGAEPERAEVSDSEEALIARFFERHAPNNRNEGSDE